MCYSGFLTRKEFKGNVLKVASSSRPNFAYAVHEIIYGSNGIYRQVGGLIASQEFGLFHIEYIKRKLWPPCDGTCNHDDNITRRHCGERAEVK